MTPKKSSQLCFLLDAGGVLPFIVRAKLLALSKEEKKLLDDETVLILLHSVEKFAELANQSELPQIFYDKGQIEKEFISTGKYPETGVRHNFDGSFVLLDELIPADATPITRLMEYNFRDAFPLMLSKQPSIWADAPRYNSPDEIIAEVKATVASMGVEFPDNFPFWSYIGMLDGFVWD